MTPLLPVTLGTGGGKSVVVSSALQAATILSQRWNGGHPSNGISKLYAQLLAAKLNIRNGGDGSAVSAVITAADGFLAAFDQSDWKNLSNASQNQVLSWHSTLDNYNNGLIGPGHCE